jgi:hypothetical protein
MNAARMVVFILGIALVILGAWMLFFQAGLNKWVPIGVAGAGLLILIGLMVVGFSEEVPEERRVEHIDEHHHD